MPQIGRYLASPLVVWPLLVTVVWVTPSTLAQVSMVSLWTGVGLTHAIVSRMRGWGEMYGVAVPPGVTAEADDLARRLGVPATPVRVVTNHPSEASVERWRNGNYICVDAALLSAGADQRRAIVAHELAHLRVGIHGGWTVAALVGCGLIAILPVGWLALAAALSMCVAVVLGHFQHSRNNEFAADLLVITLLPELAEPLAGELARVAADGDVRTKPSVIDTHPPALWRIHRINQLAASPTRRA